jgi:hypothetical protein
MMNQLLKVNNVRDKSNGNCVASISSSDSSSQGCGVVAKSTKTCSVRSENSIPQSVMKLKRLPPRHEIHVQTESDRDSDYESETESSISVTLLRTTHGKRKHHEYNTTRITLKEQATKKMKSIRDLDRKRKHSKGQEDEKGRDSKTSRSTFDMKANDEKGSKGYKTRDVVSTPESTKTSRGHETPDLKPKNLYQRFKQYLNV